MSSSTTARSFVVLVGMGAVLLTSCSTGSTDSPPAADAGTPESSSAAQDDGLATSASDAAQFPVTIEHAFGETTIPSDPQRIATVGWVDQDMVVALGELPVGATRISWGGNEAGSTDWFDSAVETAGADPATVTRYDDSDGIPADEIAALQPDLILGTNSGMTQDEFDSLSKIAPVVAFPETAWGTPWRDSLEMVGEAIGREAEAEAVLAETESQIAAGVADYPQLEGLSMAWTWYTASDLSTIGVYTTTDLRPQLMLEFGMVDADKAVELTEANAGAFSANLSAEQADTLDADLLFFYAEDDAQIETLVNDPLVGQTPALASGAYVGLTDMPLITAITSPTPLSMPVVLEQFLPLAGEAAEKVQ